METRCEEEFMKVLGISGSQRKNGNTSFLLRTILKTLEEKNVDVEIIYLKDYKIGPCIGCECCSDSFKCIIKDDYNEIVEKLYEADGIILGSPTYWYSVTSDMKKFIDRSYSLIRFPKTNRTQWTSAFQDSGKCGAVVAVCEQKEASMMGFTYKNMELFLNDLDIKVCSGVKALRVFEADAAEKEEKLIQESKECAKDLYDAIKLNKM